MGIPGAMEFKGFLPQNKNKNEIKKVKLALTKSSIETQVFGPNLFL